jgi:polygalacturonase
MSGGVHDITVRNCTFIGTDVGLRFKSTRGRGGVVSGIDIENIYMKDIVADAIIFNLFYAGKPATELSAAGAQEEVPAADETTPEFRDINIKGVYCNGAGGRAIYICGLPEMPVRNVSVSDCLFQTDEGIVTYYTEGFTTENVTVK